MPLDARDKIHAGQIAAGIAGRNRGHEFERVLAEQILELPSPLPEPWKIENKHLVWGDPGVELYRYIIREESVSGADLIGSYWLGGLATSGEGDCLFDQNGEAVKGSKSDILLKLRTRTGNKEIGVSVKTCFNATPTNAQLFCSTASAFCSLLRTNGIAVSQAAERALKMFCGDAGFQPMDEGRQAIRGRLATPERWFWEELDTTARNELENTLETRHADILTVLLQKAYPGDPYPPKYLMHVRHKAGAPDKVPLALYSVDELVRLSVSYKGFETRSYGVHKGRYKNDPDTHLAPRFGIVQFQQLGNVQNRSQLQFNLQANYFNKLPYEK